MTIDHHTHTYKVAEGCEIRADVHRAPDGVTRPGIVWIHGGALIMGHRGNISDRQRDLYVSAGYVVISIDYRLAPEAKLDAIIGDVRDAFRWVREEGPALFGVDPRRLAVIGHSGGGYLALMSGMCVEPRPRAVVSFYGYGDIAGAWYSRPDPFYCRAPAVTRDEAYAAVGGPVISAADGPHHRDRFYLYCRQQGLWPKEVTGHDPDAEPDAFDPFCPVRNVTPDYPPTFLSHGTADPDVPYEQSVAMADALARAGTEHELITIPDGAHGFDGADTPEVEAVFARVLAFLAHHLR
ncbi:MAG: alpha/beta hydrolase [Armatimonadota bacterium]|nr:MAG: alpha/beta hydrolase [Armatimonadota bacterium]